MEAPGTGTTGETDGSRTKVQEAPLYPGRSETGAALANPATAKVMRASFWKTIVRLGLSVFVERAVDKL
jgi:hypothetical protein